MGRGFGCAMGPVDILTGMDMGATARHERTKLEAVEDAAARLTRAAAEHEAAREARDAAVRAAVRAGVPSQDVARAAGLSGGRVSTIAPAR